MKTSLNGYDFRFTVVDKIIGPATLFIGAIIMASANVVYSYFGSQLSNKFAVMFWTAAIQTIALAPFALRSKINNIYAFFTGSLCLLLINVMGALAFLFADPNDVTAILSTCIFVTPVLSYILFHIRFNQCILPIMLLLCFLGIVLLVEPPFIFKSSSLKLTNMLGYLFAFINMLSHAFLMCVQKVAQESDAAMLFTALLLISLGNALCCVYFNAKFLPLDHFSMFSISSMCNCIAFFLLLKGWTKTDPRISSIIMQNQTLFTFIISWVFGMENSHLIMKAIGVVTVIISTTIYLWYTFDEDNTIRYKSRLMKVLSSQSSMDGEQEPLLC